MTEQKTTERMRNKFIPMLWTNEEAETIGNFLKGDRFNSQTTDKKHAWNNLAETTNIEDAGDIDQLLAETRIQVDRHSIIGQDSEDEPQEEEFEQFAQMSAETLIRIVEPVLRKCGVWDSSEHRRTVAGSGTRKAAKRNFSQSEKLGNSASGTAVSEGGPHIKGKIYVPRTTDAKNRSVMKTRKSLAHEVNHHLRAMTNKQLWSGHEDGASQTGLRESTNEDKRKYIGGFYVGSNMQGSEAVGDLFADIVHCKTTKEKEPTISEILPTVAKRLEKRLNKFETKLETSKKMPNTRYFAANTALLHHLGQLTKLGHGELQAIDLVAVGSMGYGSLEKMPDLIRLGIMNQEKYQRMRQVVRNLSKWLTSPSENGFVIREFNL